MMKIPGDLTQAEPLNKGWSSDKKFCLEAVDGEKLLLRVADISRYEEKKREFEMMRRVAALGVPMSRPIDFGRSPDGQNVYTVLSWCDGEEAETSLPELAETDQYALGLEAGKILARIHSLPAPEDRENWTGLFNHKIDFKIEKYRTCGLRFEGDEMVVQYLRNHRDWLDHRPQCCQHGDYHVGNMIVDQRGRLFIIDFNRWSYGDPWEEFNRIVWSASVSPHFATGQLNGYFGGRPPLDFFQLMTFYICGNLVGSIYWAIPFGPAQVEVMMKQSADILAWFDDLSRPVPSWYLENLPSA